MTRPTTPGAARLRAASILACMVIGASTAACGGARRPPLLPEPIAFIDTLPIAEPASRELMETIRPYAAIVGSGASALNVRRWTGTTREAVNLTRFDDVVGSAWFKRRNGYRTMTADEVARGPTTVGPDPAGPLRVVARSEGRTPGFTIEDARGDRYLLKFDPPGNPHLATAADVITSRLLYAAGYHTPENYIVRLDPDRLVTEPDAGVTPDEVPAILDAVARLPDGRLIAMASKYLPGTPKGPFRFEGRRGDDPNDHFYHQYRRELRGLFVLAAWLNHVELHFGNTLDTYVAGRYLRHNLIDFGESLGSGTLGPLDVRAGRESNFDLAPVLARFVTLGFARPAWSQGDTSTIHPSIGRLPTDEYDPADWRPRWSNAAFSHLTDRDGYWGAKLVAAFSDEQIRAAVAEGGLSDPRAARTLGDMILYRRDRTVEYWYGRVSPIENVAIEVPPASIGDTAGFRLTVSFDDLGIRDLGRSGASTTYRYRFRHEGLRIDLAGAASAVDGTSRQAVSLVVPDLARSGGLEDSERIAVLEVVVVRDGGDPRAARVHLALDPSGREYGVVGLEH